LECRHGTSDPLEADSVEQAVSNAASLGCPAKGFELARRRELRYLGRRGEGRNESR